MVIAIGFSKRKFFLASKTYSDIVKCKSLLFTIIGGTNPKHVSNKGSSLSNSNAYYKLMNVLGLSSFKVLIIFSAY